MSSKEPLSHLRLPARGGWLCALALLVSWAGGWTWGQVPGGRISPVPSAAPTAPPLRAGVFPATPYEPPPPAADVGAVDRAALERLIDERIRARGDPKAAPDGGTGPKEAVVGSDPNMKATWRDGVTFEAPARDFVFHVGGAVHYDLALYGAGDQVQFGPGGTGPFDDGVNLRRGRLRAEGSLYEVVNFLFELEFANGVRAADTVFNTPGPTDANVTITKIPVLGNVRIGNQKEPFSLEHLNSYRYLEFMERSPLFDAFSPTAFNNGFTPGIQAFNAFPASARRGPSACSRTRTT